MFKMRDLTLFFNRSLLAVLTPFFNRSLFVAAISQAFGLGEQVAVGYVLCIKVLSPESFWYVFSHEFLLSVAHVLSIEVGAKHIVC